MLLSLAIVCGVHQRVKSQIEHVVELAAKHHLMNILILNEQLTFCKHVNGSCMLKLQVEAKYTVGLLQFILVELFSNLPASQTILHVCSSGSECTAQACIETYTPLDQ